MRIGFDAKRAVSNLTGLGNYSRTLIRSLSQFYPENRYLLYSPAIDFNPRLEPILQSVNVVVKTPNSLIGRVFKPLWRSYFVSRDLKRDEVELFHGLSNELPHNLKRFGIRSVVTIHDLIFMRYPEFYGYMDRKIYRSKVHYACRNADKIVAVSEQTKQDLMELLKVEPSRVTVIYQSCDPIFGIRASDEDKNGVRSKYSLPPEYILYVGSIEERKNLLGLVKALDILKNRLKVQLVVIGNGGGYRQKVVAFIAEKGLGNQVRILGDANFDDFPAIYQMASALVYPSFFEGFGIPIIEALWSRTPVITSTGSCFAEAGGPASLYVTPTDTEEIASAIERVTTDSTMRTTMADRGFAFVQRFSMNKTSEQVHSLYRQVLAS